MKSFVSVQKSKARSIWPLFTAKFLAIALVSCPGLARATPLYAATVLAECTNPFPLFQFEVFYYQDVLEIEPGAGMTFTGPVAVNAGIFLGSPASLTFASSVSTVSGITLEPGSGPVDFAGALVTNVFPYALPGDIYLSNGYGILQMPPPGESPASPSGAQRLYNAADMIVVVSSNNAISVSSGVDIDNQAVVISSNQWQVFMNTNGSFYDERDGLTVNPVVIDVSNLVNWSATNDVLRPVLVYARDGAAADVESIYVADLRNPSNAIVTTEYIYVTNLVTNNFYTTNPPPAPAAGTYVPGSLSLIIVDGRPYYVYIGITNVIITDPIYYTNIVLFSQPGIVLSNGAVLPPQGLSIATPDPAYIVGNWNVQTSFSGPSDAGLSDTSHSLPSAIFADAVTVLYQAWNPANGASPLTDRPAVNDTVNAAIYSGNVPTTNGVYSGGLEDFLRLLENWSGQTLTFNGSLCCMFSSRIANAPYPGTGSVYDPPTRNWAFDINFANPSKIPPLTPVVEMSTPVIQAKPETTGNVLLSCSTWPGVTYTVQYTTNLSQGNWASLASFPGSGNDASVSDPATNAQRFYRLQTYR